MLADRSGLDLNELFQLLAGGYAGSRILETRGERIVSEDYSPSGAARWPWSRTSASPRRSGSDRHTGRSCFRPSRPHSTNSPARVRRPRHRRNAPLHCTALGQAHPAERRDGIYHHLRLHTLDVGVLPTMRRGVLDIELEFRRRGGRATVSPMPSWCRNRASTSSDRGSDVAESIGRAESANRRRFGWLEARKSSCEMRCGTGCKRSAD